jgi:hypothetical protein
MYELVDPDVNYNATFPNALDTLNGIVGLVELIMHVVVDPLNCFYPLIICPLLLSTKFALFAFWKTYLLVAES